MAKILGFFVNIPLNYMLIFGEFGLRELSMEGSALASLAQPDWTFMRNVIRLEPPVSVSSLAEARLFSVSCL